MSIKIKTTLTVSVLSSLLFASPALALFDTIRDAREAVNDVTSVVEIIGYTEAQMGSLMGTLGLVEGSIDFVDAQTGSDVAALLYKGWRNELQGTDRAIADQLLTQYAAGAISSREDLAVTSWFQGLATDEQVSVLGLFDGFEQIEALVDDQSSFLDDVLP